MLEPRNIRTVGKVISDMIDDIERLYADKENAIVNLKIIKDTISAVKDLDKMREGDMSQIDKQRTHFVEEMIAKSMVKLEKRKTAKRKKKNDK